MKEPIENGSAGSPGVHLVQLSSRGKLKKDNDLLWRQTTNSLFNFGGDLHGNNYHPQAEGMIQTLLNG